MGKRQGPVGLGYMPKGGARAARAHNDNWRERLEAARPVDDRSTTLTTDAVPHVATDAQGTRASAASAPAGRTEHDAPTVVERWAYGLAGFAGGVAASGWLYVVGVR